MSETMVDEVIVEKFREWLHKADDSENSKRMFAKGYITFEEFVHVVKLNEVKKRKAVRK